MAKVKGKSSKGAKGKHWSEAEIINLLDIVSDILPRGTYEWESVVTEYNNSKSAGVIERDIVGCRNKYSKSLRNRNFTWPSPHSKMV